MYTKLDKIHAAARSNRWLYYFAVFLRITLAFGFISSGIVKIMGERFASGLSVNHPMGQYLEALHHTGFYYTFIGILQVLAAILLLIPQTVLLGALLYFPIILNICILSFAVRFEGSILTSPLMVLGCLFLICWNYDKVKYLFILNRNFEKKTNAKIYNNRFPLKFFSAVLATVLIIVLIIRFGFEVMPRNSSKDCNLQFIGTNRTRAGQEFCNCIHKQGKTLDSCLQVYNKAEDDN
jgi:uncharacterized membrane protein YphA (DoxX/SURF4 family)